MRGIYSCGFEKPSYLQQSLLPIMITENAPDIICQGQAGTGKTATFAISMLQQWKTNGKKVQGLILCPTRELAMNVRNFVAAIGEFLNVKVSTCVGGIALWDMETTLMEADIVVSTPGRLWHAVQSGYLDLSNVRMLVLDEMDETMSRGFRDQVYLLLKNIPLDTQVCLFSCTMPSEVLEIVDRFMKNPVSVVVRREEKTLDGVKQFFIDVEKEDWKLDTLLDLLEVLGSANCVIYCNTRRKVEQLACELSKRVEFTVSFIHQGMDRKDRLLIQQQFSMGSSRILITMDLVTQSEIHPSSHSLAINYELPLSKDTYLRRIGTSGHFGRKSFVINLVTKDELVYMREIEQYFCTIINECPLDIAQLIY